MMWNGTTGDGWVWLLALVLAILGAAMVAVAIVAGRRERPSQPDPAVEILRRRLAAGEVDEAEYRDRMSSLTPSTSHPRFTSPRWVPTVAAISAGVLFLGAVSAAALASRPGPAGVHVGPYPGGPACGFPALEGQVVDVVLADMGGMMQGGMMQGGAMRIVIRPSTVAAGEVSFRVQNLGHLVHELVVLPLPSGGAGTRPVGSDGTVSEDGSLGEVSKTCGAGAGDGIVPGGIGWLTLHLDPGRYELICNLPNHYASGMFTELDVT